MEFLYQGKFTNYEREEISSRCRKGSKSEKRSIIARLCYLRYTEKEIRSITGLSRKKVAIYFKEYFDRGGELIELDTDTDDIKVGVLAELPLTEVHAKEAIVDNNSIRIEEVTQVEESNTISKEGDILQVEDIALEEEVDLEEEVALEEEGNVLQVEDSILGDIIKENTGIKGTQRVDLSIKTDLSHSDTSELVNYSDTSKKYADTLASIKSVFDFILCDDIVHEITAHDKAIEVIKHRLEASNISIEQIQRLSLSLYDIQNKRRLLKHLRLLRTFIRNGLGVNALTKMRECYDGLDGLNNKPVSHNIIYSHYVHKLRIGADEKQLNTIKDLLSNVNDICEL